MPGGGPGGGGGGGGGGVQNCTREEEFPRLNLAQGNCQQTKFVRTGSQVRPTILECRFNCRFNKQRTTTKAVELNLLGEQLVLQGLVPSTLC